MKPIYLDTAAATALEPSVARAIRDAEKVFANPSSLHAPGVAAAAALVAARRAVANVLACQPSEIIFTSGGTEANNLALNLESSNHLITHLTAHSSILKAARALESRGGKVTYLPVDQAGLITPESLKRALRVETMLVSLEYGNSATGVIQPVRELAKVIRHFKSELGRGVLEPPFFHLDACQAARHLELKVAHLGVDLLTLDANKIYGPKGVGVLYARRGIKLWPIFHGGGQEAGRRSGTENLPGAVGLARALELCEQVKKRESARLIKLRDYFIKKLLAEIPEAILNGVEAPRLPHFISVSFLDAESEAVVLGLDAKGVACSSGSACSVNVANDLDSSVRFTLDRVTTRADLDYVLQVLPSIITRARLEKIIKN